ncbi:MAG: hypothetical protein ACK5XN_20335 [Bacteroidota bacterium]|jgi:hypothetical protein
MEKSNLKLTKIPIEYLLEILEKLYNDGYDYFDLEGIIDLDREKDIIRITVSDDYLTEDQPNIDDYEQLL